MRRIALTMISGFAMIATTVTPAASQKPMFEVASIKRNTGASRAISCCGGPGRLAGTNVTLGMLITTAYKVQDFQVVGAPGWVNSDRYDIEAKASDAAAVKEQESSRDRCCKVSSKTGSS